MYIWYVDLEYRLLEDGEWEGPMAVEVYADDLDSATLKAEDRLKKHKFHVMTAEGVDLYVHPDNVRVVSAFRGNLQT